MAGEMGMTGIGLGDAMVLAQRNMGGGYGMDGSMAMWNNPLAWMMMYGMMRNGGWGMDNGNGNGGCNRGCVTPFELNQGLNDQDMRAGVRGIQQGICDATYALTGAINQTQHAISDCCCQTNNNIERTGCNIIQAIHGEGEATRGLILSEKIEGLRDRVNEKDRELQSAQFQLSQLSQNATLINALRPTPIPAYLAVNPYQAVGYSCNNSCNGFGGFGNNWAA